MLVDERLIWYLSRYLVMSLLQRLFVSLSRIISASKAALREVKNMIGVIRVNLWGMSV